MVNRILLSACLLGLFAILGLNVIPLLSPSQSTKYIDPMDVSGSAIRHKGRLFTLNYDQQKKLLDIMNRAIPYGKVEVKKDEQPLEFESLIIYRFIGTPVVIEPVGWVKKDLYFKAPAWSEGYMMEVSDGELYQMISDSYDRESYH